MTKAKSDLHLATTKWRVTISLVMLVLYVAFILLVGFGRPFLTRVVVPGLSLAIICGLFLMIVPCILTWTYVGWANSREDYNHKIEEHRE